MPSSYFCTLGVAFSLLLSVLISPDVHAGKLVRRLSYNSHPDSVFIMDNALVYVNNALLVYTPDATVAFGITRHIIDPVRGNSQYILTDHYGGIILVLDSYDDTCFSKTHYNDKHGLSRFKVDPRGIKADKWYISTATMPGVKFVFERNIFNKGGKIVNENTDKVVATLSVEDRKEPWLLSLFHSKSGYVLRTDGTLPAYDLAALMALVQMRVDLCGL
ncbi:hypothetical protein CROQUDRAFT_652388 [Cronartium quercuum f. sp. fusiforme G11]|uniref:Uncharacterized protein n=1 Tax=Cronartium quercuum f. sp. fusiforme G11 TaxID=708437 RepID=A0A9P6TFB3_9BASI|nr:hypothetical protein CROQUDRAFT_652388 [Cronartium quercuum f. sp. fusiforme G11]